MVPCALCGFEGELWSTNRHPWLHHPTPAFSQSSDGLFRPYLSVAISGMPTKSRDVVKVSREIYL